MQLSPQHQTGCVLWVDSASYATRRLTSGGSVSKPLKLRPTFSESVRGYTWLSNRTPPSLAGNKPLTRFFLFFPRPPHLSNVCLLLCGYLKATTQSHTHVPVRKKQQVPGPIPRKNRFPGTLRRLPLITEAGAISQGEPQ